jgi:hypothetical protein
MLGGEGAAAEAEGDEGWRGKRSTRARERKTRTRVCGLQKGFDEPRRQGHSTRSIVDLVQYLVKASGDALVFRRSHLSTISRLLEKLWFFFIWKLLILPQHPC